ncbi:phage pre-tape measure protein [Alsobacter sp. R-9]
MVGLLDLAPATETVRGVTVYGVSAEGIAVLLRRFPELRTLMTGGAVDAEALLKAAPEAVKAIIAAGIGHPGSTEQEEAAARLPIEIQADFLEAIIRTTLPSGFGPFAERVKALAGRTLNVQPVASGGATAPDTTSPRPSPGSYKRGTSRRI